MDTTQQPTATEPVEPKPLIDYSKVCLRLGNLSKGTVQALAKSGQLPSVLIGNRRLFRPEDVEAFIEAHLTSTSEAGTSTEAQS